MPLAFRSARVSLALAAALTLAVATAHAQGGPPQVTVAPPLASRVAQWDEFTGRFEAMERVEVRPRVSGYIDQVQFPRRQHRQAGRPAVHHRPAAVPTRRRFRQSRRGAHPGADRARPGRLPAGPGIGEDRRDAGQRHSTSARPTWISPTRRRWRRRRRCTRPNSTWNGPRSAPRSAAASPIGASIPATWSPAVRTARRCSPRSSGWIRSTSCSTDRRPTISATAD